MSIRFTCSECGKRFKVEEEYAGKRGRCPCGNQLQIPDISQEGQEQSQVDDTPGDYAKGNTKTWNRLYVYLILFCIVAGALGISMLAISRPKDAGSGDSSERNAQSLTAGDSDVIRNTANDSSSAWALFLTNDTFVSGCYIGKPGPKNAGRKIIDGILALAKESDSDVVLIGIDASFTIAEVVNTVGPYKKLNQDRSGYTIRRRYNEYLWDCFALHTDPDSNSVIMLVLDCTELSKILPPGMNLTEAAENHLSRSERAMP